MKHLNMPSEDLSPLVLQKKTVSVTKKAPLYQRALTLTGCIALLITLIPNPTWAKLSPLHNEDYKRLSVFTTKQSVLYEQYLNTDKGLASVMGYHFDIYFHNSISIFTAIFGAVGGKRGGYGIAAVGAAYHHPLTPRLSWDLKGMLGSGGGGGVPAGGGFAIALQTGPSLKLGKKVSLECKYGQLTFPNTAFSTPILNLGLSYKIQKLHLPF